MSENGLSSHVNDCLDWEVCNQVGQEGSQQGYDECLEDACDLENDYQSGNEDCDEDDNFKVTKKSVENNIRNLQVATSTLYHWRDTLKKDPDYVFTKGIREFLNEVNSLTQKLLHLLAIQQTENVNYSRQR